jgi:integrase/recombinase XerD
MHLGTSIDNYLDHLSVERALSQNTLLAYGRDLNAFASFCDGHGVRDVQSIAQGQIRGWLAQLVAAGATPTTSARKLSALRGLLRFLRREGVLTDDPSSLIERPKLGRKLPKPLSIEQVLLLVDKPRAPTLVGLRDRALLSLCYAAGLRVSELLGLKLGDLDLERGVVVAFGKGKKARLVPMAEVTLQHLGEYLTALRAQTVLDNSALVFPSRRGRPYSRQMFWKLVRRCARQVGIPEHVHPHRLRHSFATHLLKGGADLRSVQTLLGHTDIATTQVYTLVTQDHLTKAHKQSHPRG